MSAVFADGDLIAGRYRIEGLIGSGGMGVVYRAVQLPMGRAVALKVLRPEHTHEPRSRARFEREAKIACALEHPSAVLIYDFGEHEGRAFLAMELAEGRSLRELVAASPRGLEVVRAVDLCHQLADVLVAAHALGLVHRDLSPANVIVEASAAGERARVLDFGLAFELRPDGGGRLTREGVVVGTPAYLSPEQARGEDVGAATDIYALGCVLHELLSGAPPFVGTEIEVLTRQMYAPPPALLASSPVPAALDGLRRRMLDKRAERRPDAAEVRASLSALDPDPDRGRARAKHDGYLGARAARMVPAPPTPEVQSAARSQAPALEVGVVGGASAELLIGLAANGVAAFVVRRDEPLEDVAAVYAPGASVSVVEALAKQHRVVTDAPRGDVARLSALMRAGAADVVVQPVTVADLVKKLRRVARRARR